jgi:CheY-like chemotaxis protein
MDDEEPVRRAAAALLEKLGYEVACAASGEEALESYRAASEAGRPFAVVILDLTVPGRMGGKECARHLGRLDPSVRAIVSSGYSTDPVMANHEAFGFVGVLPKPYRVEELTAALHRAMQHGS